MEKNPYAAPRAAVSDVTPERQGRPVLVWVITILMAIGVLGSIASALAALAGSPLGGPEAAEQLRFLSPLDHVVTLVASAITAASAVELFRLKRRAFWLFAASLAVTAVVVFPSLALRPAYRAILDNGGAWVILIGWAVNFAILAYIWRLHAKGVLR
jgi:hypothetical protein